MVATDTEVMGWVEKQLQDNPEVTVDELFEGAKILRADVAELNKRQFHARYPLQVKRRAKRAAAAAAAAEAAAAEAAAAEAAPAEAADEAEARRGRCSRTRRGSGPDPGAGQEGNDDGRRGHELGRGTTEGESRRFGGRAARGRGQAERRNRRPDQAPVPRALSTSGEAGRSPGGGCRGRHQAPSPSSPRACGSRTRARSGCTGSRTRARARARRSTRPPKPRPRESTAKLFGR